MNGFRRQGQGDSTWVADLRGTTAAAKELDWFFGCAESAMGLSSNFVPLMEMALTGVKGTLADPADTSMESRLDAAHAARVIRARLLAIPSRDALTLSAAYEPRQWPTQVEEVFGRLAGVAVQTAEATKEYAKSVAQGSTRAASVAAWLEERIAGRFAVSQVHWEAQCRWTRAMRAYRDARGDGPCVVPAER